MSRPRRRAGARTGRLKVGDRVRFTLGGRRVIGTIAEDRGNIGVGGRRLFGVRVQLDWERESLLELPADELQAA